MWVNNLPKVATQWSCGATRDSNRGRRVLIPSALPLHHRATQQHSLQLVSNPRKTVARTTWKCCFKFLNRLSVCIPSARVSHDDSIVDRETISWQTSNVPRLDFDRFAECLGKRKLRWTWNAVRLHMQATKTRHQNKKKSRGVYIPLEQFFFSSRPFPFVFSPFPRFFLEAFSLNLWSAVSSFSESADRQLWDIPDPKTHLEAS